MLHKKILQTAVAAFAALTISASAFAALSAAGAREIAESWMPAGTTYQSIKEDSDDFDVYFFNEALSASYKVEVSKWSEKITEIKRELRGAHGSATVVLSEAQAAEVVRSEFPNATIRKIKLDYDDGYQVYEVNFSSGSIYGEMKINPETGAIIESEIKY